MGLKFPIDTKCIFNVTLNTYQLIEVFEGVLKKILGS